MQTIPPEVLTLLKSKQMVGPNRPTADFYVVGHPGYLDLTDPTSWTLWRTFVGDTPSRSNGNITETADGRAVCIYVEDGSVKLAFGSSVEEILNGTANFDTSSAITLATGLERAQSSIALIDGKLHVCIAYLDGYIKAEFWRDLDGNGNGMVKVSDIATDLSSGSYYTQGTSSPEISLIHRLGATTLAIMVPYLDKLYKTTRCCYSLDNGETWNLGAHIVVSSPHHLGVGCSKSFLIINDTSFIVANLASSGSGWLCLYTDSGATYTRGEWTRNWGEWPANEPWHAGFIRVKDNIYMCRRSMTY